jgi:type IV pilus assembly protein PilY1
MSAVGFKKRNVQLRRKAQVLCLLSALFVLLCMAQPADAAYGYRKAITIPAAGVSGNLFDFPVVVSIASDNQLRSVANGGHVQNNNGFDIVFRAADGSTPLPHEIESYYPLTGQLTAWVKVPALSSSAATVIYMYYGDSSVTSLQENPTSVWDGNYKGVWHLNNSVLDSTSSGNNGTDNSTTDTTGKVAKGREFNGTGGYVSTASQDLKSADSFTISLWFKADATNFAHHLIWQGENDGNGWGGQQEMHLTLGNRNSGNSYDNRLVFFLGYREASAGNPLSISYAFSDTGSWHHAAVVVSGMSGSPAATLYLDGAAIGSDTSSTSETVRADWNTGFRLGRPYPNERRFDGKLDEVRIATINRSADWIRTEYNNQSSPGTFHSIGAEESIAAPVYYQITAVAGTGGSITPNGIAMVESGTSKTYTMTPASGYRVSDVRVDGQVVTPTDNQYTFTNVNQDHEITVAYVPIQIGPPEPPPPGLIPGCAQNMNVSYSNTGFNAADFELISVGVTPEKRLYLDTGNVAIDPNHIVIPFTQEVAVYFMYEGAGYTLNDFGYMLASAGETGTKYPIPDYDNINDNNNNGVLDQSPSNNSNLFGDMNGDGVVNALDNRKVIGTFAAGTELVFYLKVDNADYNPTYDFAAASDDVYFYTKTAWNKDTYRGTCTNDPVNKLYYLGRGLTAEGACVEQSNWMRDTAVTRARDIFGLQFDTNDTASLTINRGQRFSHVIVGAPRTNPNAWVLGWEDLVGGGDTDHNDMVFIVERRTGGQSVLRQPITPRNAGDYYTGVTLTVYDNLTCAGKTDIVYYVSIDNGANWREITDWDEIWEIDSSKNPVRELTTWAPGTPALTRRTVRVDFSALGIIGRELLWKAEFRSDQQGCEPQILDVILNADLATHGTFSRSSPVTKANVLYSGYYETPALSWLDKTLRGHLTATRLYAPTDPNATAELALWDAGQVLSTREPNTRSIYFPQISIGQVSSQEIAVGDGTLKTFNGTLNPAPITATTLSITDGRETFRDKHTDVLEGNLGGRGTINRFTGAFSLEFKDAPLAGVPIRASYSHYSSSPALVSFTDANVTKETLALDNTTIIPHGLVYDFDHDNDVDDSDAHYVMRWVKGYKPGTALRREWLLDPIDHSVPAVLTAPGLPTWYFGTATTKTERDSFKAFMLAKNERRAVVFVGSRSGMLHAFDAGAFRHGDNTCTANVEEKRGYFNWGVSCATGPDYGTGEELWAFIPANLLPRLKNNLMARLNTAHTGDYNQAYVDASPALSDVYINGAWRTVLLSAEGNGGDTVFCLDVTDPYNPTFLWEFADPDLFRSRSSPSIAKIGRIVHNGTPKWVAFFVSGNDARYDRTQYPSVYMIDIETGHLLSRIMLDVEPSGIGGVPSGQPAAVDSDGNGYIDRFYIGTDKGYLYKVNIPDDPESLKYSISQCVINKSYTRESTGDTIPSDRRYQPIYGSPVVSVDNSVNENGQIDYKVLIFYGTGDSPYSDEDINMSGTRYYFLAYIDRAEKGVCNDSLVSLDWFYELPEGHRVFASAFSAAGLIYFGTSTADTEDPCGQDSRDNNNGEIFAFSMHQPSPVVTPAFNQRVGNVVASPMVEDQHLYVKGLGLGLQSFGRGIYNNDVLTGGWPEIGIRAWREIF